MNDKALFPFVEFKAGPFNMVKPTDITWASHNFVTSKISDLISLLDFFGVPRGGSPGNDNLSPYIEVFSVPNIDSLGFARRRGNPDNLMPTSIFL